jgi:hypothetical protein
MITAISARLKPRFFIHAIAKCRNVYGLIRRILKLVRLLDVAPGGMSRQSSKQELAASLIVRREKEGRQLRN